MKSCSLPVVVASLLLLLCLSSVIFADDQKPAAVPPPAAPSAPLSKENRQEIIRVFTADLVFAHSPFPMGRQGLVLKDSVISPGTEELQQMMTMWGAAAKPGDRAIISAVFVKPDRI